MKIDSCIGTVQAGKFIPSNVAIFKKAFFGHEGKKVLVTVERLKNKRSTPQNSYYFGVVIPLIADQIGELDPTVVHDLLKAKFNSQIIVIGDEEIIKPLSTAKLSTEDFQKYIEKIRMWAAQFLSLYIPDPNEI